MQAFQGSGRIDLQVDALALFFHEGAGFFTHDNTTTGGDDGASFCRGCTSQCTGFTVTKVVFTVLREDGRDGCAACCFDEGICIQKGFIEALCQDAAYGAFAAAGKSRQEDVSHIKSTPLITLLLRVAASEHFCNSPGSTTRAIASNYLSLAQTSGREPPERTLPREQ